ncbi:MAG: adenine deaminase [Sclerophora amabilis]|nr:MAG: adenine deaminase [Sclerophora amabilis]
MCNSSLHRLLARLPKCEHHIHLEGALSPSLLYDLASKNEVTLPSPTDDPAWASPSTLAARYKRFTSLDDFLHYYLIGMSVLQYASDFEALAWDYFLHAKADNVMHAEVCFDPQAHTERGVAYSTVLSGVRRACWRAETELGISTKLIVCFLRHLSVPSALQTFNVAKPDLLNGTLAGIGLDSSEKGYPPELWEDIFSAAKEQGIMRTAHAGEEGPPEYIASALSSLHVSRIDHGIALASSPLLLDTVAASPTLLTVCPISNVRLRCVSSIAELPIRIFLDKGVKFSINSDDPAYFSGYVLDNYCAVQEAFDLSVEDWNTICRAGIEGSWCSTERKSEMRALLERTF